MVINIIIQARMGSTRLTGKVMKPIVDDPMIVWVIRACVATTLAQGIIVAMPNLDSVGHLSVEANKWPVTVVSPDVPEGDVAGRFAKVLEVLSCTAFVRICADSPFLDARAIDEEIAAFRGRGSLLRFGGSIPGSHIEIINTRLFLKCLPNFTPEDREHVTTYFKRHCGLVIDTQEDYDRLKHLDPSMDSQACLDELARRLL